MMIHYLTDPVVASHRQLDTNWSVSGLLAEVAKSNDPPFHALIDGGALVTGMTNLEVARCVRIVDVTPGSFSGVSISCGSLRWRGTVCVDQDEDQDQDQHGPRTLRVIEHVFFTFCVRLSRVSSIHFFWVALRRDCQVYYCQQGLTFCYTRVVVPGVLEKIAHIGRITV